MDIIVLDGDSDEGDHTTKEDVPVIKGAEECGRPAKRQRQEPPSQWDTANKVDLCEGLSHVSDTVNSVEPSVTEAPVQPASAAADDAESPTLSPQQVAAIRPCTFLELFVAL